MSPYEKLIELYAGRPKADLGALLDWHSRHGFVFITPDFSVFGRPVDQHAEREAIVNAEHLFQREECNCWFIHAHAGDLRKVWGILPFPLGWVAFERMRGGALELQIISAERIRSKCDPIVLPDAPDDGLPPCAAAAAGKRGRRFSARLSVHTADAQCEPASSTQ